MIAPPSWKSVIVETVGAVAGGALGFVLYGWIVQQGFQAMLVPGALLGLGAGLFAEDDSKVRGVLCAVAAVFLGCFAEGWFRPFVADVSLGYFVRNLTSLPPVTLLLIAIGAALAYYLGKDSGWLGRRRGRS